MTPVEIKLYQTSSEPTVVNKPLTDVATVSGYFKQVQDISAPVIDLAFDSTNFNTYFNANYAYIEVFHRYYFISRREIGVNNILSIYMDEDVLMSFKDEIYELTPLVTRQASANDNTIVDSAIPISIKPKITVYNGNKLKWGTSSKFIDPIDPTITDIAYYADTGDDFFTSNGIIAIQCFSNVKSTDDDVFCNGLVSSNRYYTMSMNTFETMYKNITAPTFWGSVKNEWFTDYSQSIMDIKLLPFDISKNTIYTFSEQSVVQFMLNEYDVPDENKVKLINPAMYFIASSKVEFNFDTNNYIDFMSSYEIILPYLGNVEIPPQVLNRFVTNKKCTLYIYLVINPSNWQGRYCITTNSTQIFQCKTNKPEYAYLRPFSRENILYESDYFDVGSTVPMGTTDKNQKNLGILSTAFNVATGLVVGGITGGVIGALGGVMSQSTAQAQKRLNDRRLKVGGNKYNERKLAFEQSLSKDILSSGITFGSNLLSDIMPLLANSSSIISSNTTGSDYYLLETQVIGIKTEPIPKIPDNYYTLYGKPCNITEKLGNLKKKGFTLCSAVHMTGFNKATSAEIAEIENLLLSGVIL